MTASPALLRARAIGAAIASASNAEPAQQALARLTNDWQPLSKIKLHCNAGAKGFAELVWAGKAQARYDRQGRAGERIFYRLMPEGGAMLTQRAQRRHARKAAA